MSIRFQNAECGKTRRLPSSVRNWLALDHLARVVVEIAESLGLSGTLGVGGLGGKPAHCISVTAALLPFRNATSMNSSRKPDATAYDSAAIRFIACDLRPDPGANTRVRARHLSALQNTLYQD
ncbi:MAG: hypothetical protein OXN84_14615 [Albidovulum sp.]|nr:hypothetical protein [Albidovulum sp.]